MVYCHELGHHLKASASLQEHLCPQEQQLPSPPPQKKKKKKFIFHL